ncbi:hypothetical protein BG842_07145 [Haladaptatus sp. W1]|nr:hypothetical protein BG842_07145 [Haladaptatus sp. W1]
MIAVTSGKHVVIRRGFKNQFEFSRRLLGSLGVEIERWPIFYLPDYGSPPRDDETGFRPESARLLGEFHAVFSYRYREVMAVRRVPDSTPVGHPIDGYRQVVRLRVVGGEWIRTACEGGDGDRSRCGEQRAAVHM